nr:immunoglobulin light chain junction region [Macaca mulatta]MOV71887.1 immunoglobulin light chain junction region [Macaca mulatta]
DYYCSSYAGRNNILF